MESLIEKLKKISSVDSSTQGHGKKHRHRLRRRFAKVVVDKVLADRIFRCCETSGPCDIGIAVPAGSVLSGTVTVTVLECTPVPCGPLRPVQVDILLLIKKRYTVTEPNGKIIPLESTVHKRCHQIFPPIFKLDCLDPKHVDCLVFEIKEVCADIDFVCADAAFGGHATIAEWIEVALALKLVAKEQLDVELPRV